VGGDCLVSLFSPLVRHSVPNYISQQNAKFHRVVSNLGVPSTVASS
jgi:hypothetical protein